MNRNNLVNMPQNDRSQIEQIKQEYESTPAKGLMHGVQKDAIQNGIGARKQRTEVKACKNGWKFYFELIEIDGKTALTFWDEGTTGLTGKILSSDEIEKHSIDGGLGAKHANEKLSRFLSRFESGGNTGPGSFGRGKLIFQAASSTHSLLIDSLRDDDNKYIALDRFIDGNQLKQRAIPYIDSEAKSFMNEKSGGALKPLTEHGTRITVLNVDEEIIEAFRLSFSKKNSAESLYHMISETWWEIIQMGAQITLIDGDTQLPVKLSDDLKNILDAENKVDGYRVHKKENVPILIQGNRYMIKELRLIVAPQEINREYREVWVQRKRMKVGGIQSGITINNKIQSRLAGYFKLTPELEDLFEIAEGTTHYSFNHRKAALKEVRELLKNEIEEFQESLGFKSKSTEGALRNELNQALTELNEMAADLGLPTEFASGKKQKAISLNIKSLSLPNSNTTMVELEQEIGPIEYEITNNGNTTAVGQLSVTFEQGNTIVKEVFSKLSIDIAPNESKTISVPKIKVRKEDYRDKSMMLIKGSFLRNDNATLYDKVTRSVWVGIEPPVVEDYICDLKLQPLKLPRKETSRVELGETISNIGFGLSNKVNSDIKLNIDVKFRKSKTSKSDVSDLLSILHKREFVLKAMSDEVFIIDEQTITKDTFGIVFDELANAESRKCEIFFSVRLSENNKELGLLKGQHATNKRAQPFYCGVDPAGQSIFRAIDPFAQPDDPRRSYTSGNSSDGYTFLFNVEHPSFKFVEGFGSEVRESYIQEQMIYHACTLAVKDEVFEGGLSEFKDNFNDEHLSPHDVAQIVDKMVGSILSSFRG